MVALLADRGAAIVAGLLLVIAATYLAGQSLGTLLRAVGAMIAAGGIRLGRAIAAGARHAVAAAAARRRRAPAGDAVESPAAAADAGGLGDHDTRVEKPRFAEADTADEPRWTAPTLATRVDGEDRVSTRVADPAPAIERPIGPGAGAAMAASGMPDAVAATRTTRPGGAPAAEPPKIVMNTRKPTGVQEDLPLPAAPAGPYEAPSLSLLDYVPPRGSVVDRESLHRNAETLERKLLDYKVEGRVVEIHPGPVVTMYEFLPAPGVKISQIANLADDLTMALEATSIRIVAPIPGKGVVGIEVPNPVRETVYLREMLASEEFQKSRSRLTLALGKDIFGNPTVTDMAKMPHLLIAGATGSGKSVAVNAFILSLLYNATPDDVRMILVDPKVVELQVYEGIPHLLLPVVYDPKHAAAALRWAVEEMERRYDLLARAGTRNIQSYNQRAERLSGRAAGGAEDGAGAAEAPSEAAAGQSSTAIADAEETKKLPYLVIILDEFADLMMVASKDVETAVARLAQKARAAGIHLVMATQRPSKEVITGLIKANFPSRVAFRVSSKIDSRVILDQSGADALLGFGDMLFLRPGSSLVTRLHGPFVSDEEVHRVVHHLKAQGAPEYDMEILQAAQDEADEEDPADVDPLLDEAQDIVTESRRASISFLQRKLKIGYNRSARVMEQLERRGIVGPPDSRGERQVLV
ncbi:MAG: DNA translocase FtsK [Deltaproteobacteria bacterium]|nr:DNA translocase FtsK [Deltaproteobacteria bacterium]